MSRKKPKEEELPVPEKSSKADKEICCQWLDGVLLLARYDRSPRNIMIEKYIKQCIRRAP